MLNFFIGVAFSSQSLTIHYEKHMSKRISFHQMNTESCENSLILSVQVTPCVFGQVLLASCSHAIHALFLGHDEKSLLASFEARFPTQPFTLLKKTISELMGNVLLVVNGLSQSLAFTLNPQGTLFQKHVWQTLQTIPYGEVASYSTIAQRIGKPQAVRAVAKACAANPIAILIPCHRVIGKRGALTGYRWGVERKRQLLTREGVISR